ncbi:MAG: SHOCT domain-containing protein [Bacillota bacterium]|nr:SHOCT domain-containing protein [Bacillota bacterium]MDW7685371.1 SHOCT domain-containing protein [Bacillota bacterium]
MMWYGHGMWFGGLFMMFFWVILIAVVAFLLLRGLDGSRNRPTQSDSATDRALETLNERYSKGEIDDEEYLRRKKNLLSK